MMEMLGVLAVIGVLSIAAVAGFKLAMTYHKANETIHDVMLRASNVPMSDDLYQNRPTGYAFRFPDLRNELSSMGYWLDTVKTDEYGYTYKVESAQIPVNVCTRILQLEPTDIDEMRVGDQKTIYTRRAWDLCKQTSTDTVAMSFYFEKACSTNTDCSNCQECVKERCKANYNLPGCGGGGSGDVCTTDAQCTAGECCRNGACSNNCGSGDVCTSDSNCTAGECCRNDACTNNCGSGEVCTTDAQCTIAGECCRNGACSNNCGSGDVCTSDANCTAGECCRNGACSTDCGSGDVCTSDSNCTAGECCRNGACSNNCGSGEVCTQCGEICCEEGQTCENEKCCENGICCDGTIYYSEYPSEEGTTKNYACCSRGSEVYAVYDEPASNVHIKSCCAGDVYGSDGEKRCCEREYNGVIYTSSYGQACCYGTTFMDTNGQTSCCDYGALVPNYGGVSGSKACCGGESGGARYGECCEGSVSQSGSGTWGCCAKGESYTAPPGGSYEKCCSTGETMASYDSQWTTGAWYGICCGETSNSGLTAMTTPSKKASYCCKSTENAFYHSQSQSYQNLYGGCCPSSMSVVGDGLDNYKCCTPGSSGLTCCQPGDAPQWTQSPDSHKAEVCCPVGATARANPPSCCPAGTISKVYVPVYINNPSETDSRCCKSDETPYSHDVDTDGYNGCCPSSRDVIFGLLRSGTTGAGGTQRYYGSRCCVKGASFECCYQGGTYLSGGCCINENTSASCCQAMKGDSYEFVNNECILKCATCYMRDSLGVCMPDASTQACCEMWKRSWNGEMNTCCLEGEMVSEGRCCPVGQRYYESVGGCCSFEPVNNWNISFTSYENKFSGSVVCCGSNQSALGGTCCPSGQKPAYHYNTSSPHSGNGPSEPYLVGAICCPTQSDGTSVDAVNGVCCPIAAPWFNPTELRCTVRE